jgi:hypothetical protein
MFLSEKKYVMIKGGLGNQMSQFAFYLSLRQYFGDNVKPLNMCGSKGDRRIQIKHLFKDVRADFISSKALFILVRILATSRLAVVSSKIQYFLTLLGITCVNEKYDYTYKPEVFEPARSKLCFYLGGWHCENYFKNVEEIIRKLYKFNFDDLDPKNISLLNTIKNTESVAIHIRRGDYYTVGSKILGGVCNFNYYSKAISAINVRSNKPKYFIFSDDPKWVKKHYNLDGFYVEGNTREDSWKDMLLMSACKHNIICNSSFSWWGAWLNINNNKIVVCPSKFIASDTTTDVYPKSWLKINV